ncbi:MAG: hypothetical protein ACFFFB_22910 [Candidatus Heimdallarchaeota archaeon]
MSKKEENSLIKDSIPKIIEIEEKEIEIRQPPNNNIIEYHLVENEEKPE